MSVSGVCVFASCVGAGSYERLRGGVRAANPPKFSDGTFGLGTRERTSFQINYLRGVHAQFLAHGIGAGGHSFIPRHNIFKATNSDHRKHGSSSDSHTTEQKELTLLATHLCTPIRVPGCSTTSLPRANAKPPLEHDGSSLKPYRLEARAPSLSRGAPLLFRLCGGTHIFRGRTGDPRCQATLKHTSSALLVRLVRSAVKMASGAKPPALQPKFQYTCIPLHEPQVGYTSCTLDLRWFCTLHLRVLHNMSEFFS